MTADSHEDAPAEDSFVDADRVVRQLYRTQYRGLVRLAVLLVGDVGTAEEIVQDSFVAMHAAWPRLRNPDSAVAYLRQDLMRRSRVTARRGAARHARRRGGPLGTPPAPAAAAAPADQPTAPSAPADRPATGALLEAMRLLPNGQREALVLLFYLELPEEQAAEAMGISRRAVREHAARGRAALHGAL